MCFSSAIITSLLQGGVKTVFYYYKLLKSGLKRAAERENAVLDSYKRNTGNKKGSNTLCNACLVLYRTLCGTMAELKSQYTWEMGENEA